MPERIPNGVAKLVVFRAIASSDHVTPATSKTIAITISKNGNTSFGNPNVGALNATEMASGFYKFTLDTTDTGTNGPLAWRGSGTGIDDAGDVYEVTNAHNAGFDGVPAASANTSGGVPVIGTGSNNFKSDSSANVTPANGSIDMPTFSAAMQLNLGQYAYVTGPATAGGNSVVDVYYQVGTTNNLPAFKSSTLSSAFYLWSDGSNWYISTVNGTAGSNYFKSATARLDSAYTGNGTTTGTATAKIGQRWVDLNTILGTLSAGAAGYVGPDWGHVNAPTTTVGLTNTTIAATQQVDLNTIKTQTVTCGAGVTINANVGFAAAPGAANGGVICGSNAAITFTGTAASGSTPATAGLTLVGGAASTTSGGTAAPGIKSTGGAGAASTNGAAAGMTSDGGGTTTVSGADGVKFTGTGANHGMNLTVSGTGKGLNVSTLNVTGAASFGSTFAIASTFSASSFSYPNGGTYGDAVDFAGGTTGVGAVASVSGNVVGNVNGFIVGDVQGKVLGGGGSTITAAGVWALDDSGNPIAPASATTAISNTLGSPVGASVSADIAAVKTDTGNLVTRITATLFSGITSLAQWLGQLAGKQAANSTAQTEIRATGAGSGTYDATTDSQEAIRDRGDAAWGASIADLYVADIHFNRDQANAEDEYTIVWFKNGVPVTGGITSPTIEAIKRIDGTDLIASTALTQIGTTGAYKYTATGDERNTNGEDSVVTVTATIDGSTRTFSRIVGRDSTA